MAAGQTLSDKLEALFIDKGLTPRQISRRHRSLGMTEEQITALLLSLGLEVGGEVRPGLESSRFARCNEPAYEVKL